MRGQRAAGHHVQGCLVAPLNSRRIIVAQLLPTCIAGLDAPLAPDWALVECLNDMQYIRPFAPTEDVCCVVSANTALSAWQIHMALLRWRTNNDFSLRLQKFLISSDNATAVRAAAHVPGV